MNTIINVSIGHRDFLMDGIAAKSLEQFIQKLTATYSSEEDGQEIISDIENRIAELFEQYRENNNVQQIPLAYVEEVIEIIGEPASQENQQDKVIAKPRKSLNRNMKKRWLGGVASGLGDYFRLDPAFIRIALIALTPFFWGTPLVYLVFWLALPESNKQGGTTFHASDPAENQRTAFERILLLLIFILSIIILLNLILFVFASSRGAFSFILPCPIGTFEIILMIFIFVPLLCLALLSGQYLWGKKRKKALAPAIPVVLLVVGIVGSLLFLGWFVTKPGGVSHIRVNGETLQRHYEKVVVKSIDNQPFYLDETKECREVSLGIECACDDRVSVFIRQTGTAIPYATDRYVRWETSNDTIRILQYLEVPKKESDVDIVVTFSIPENCIVLFDPSMSHRKEFKKKHPYRTNIPYMMTPKGLIEVK